MKPASAKNKGRLLQKWVKQTILKYFPDFKEDDIRSTSMGNSGEDVQLSPFARDYFPVQIECKSKKEYAVYKDYKQACTHGPYVPMLIIKANNEKPLAVVDAEWLIRYMNSYEPFSKEQNEI